MDVYVPVCSPASSLYDARAAPLLAQHCEVLHGDADTIAAVDDKHAFSVLAAGFGLPVPDAHRMTSAQQVADFDFAARKDTYILKSIAYDPVNRLDLTVLPRPTRAATAEFARSKPISPDNPGSCRPWSRGPSTARTPPSATAGCRCTPAASPRPSR